MAKYLVIASYTAEGVKGVIAKGGTARQEAVAKMVSDVGGTLEDFYFAFGGDDAYVTVDLPDNVTAAALSMAVSASGFTSSRIVVLLTPAEIDRAAQVSISYRAPGS
jgi:uncharacterized protein with GYD domain